MWIYQFWMLYNFIIPIFYSYVIKRNPTPGSPAYEELQKKRSHKNGTVNPEAETEVAQPEEDLKGQRNQPKKKKKKK